MGQSQNRCVQVGKCLIDSKRAEQGKQSLLGSQSYFMGVFSNDFAAVDVREELCYHSLPKKQIRKVLLWELKADAEIISRTKAYEPRHFAEVRIIHLWRREEDLNLR